MKKSDGSQTLSCMNCGSPYVIYPPATGYKYAQLEPCTEGCNKIMNVLCKNCKKDTKIYWCAGHFHAYGIGG